MNDRQQVSHVLRRLTFGPTASEVDEAARTGVPATVSTVLTRRAAPRHPAPTSAHRRQQAAAVFTVMGPGHVGLGSADTACRAVSGPAAIPGRGQSGKEMPV